MSGTRLLRGRVLSFLSQPQGPGDSASYRYLEDGAVLIADGAIAAVGDWAEVAGNAPEGVETIDHRPGLILPGLIDAHLHFPQMQVLGSWAGNLLDWLDTYTFVAEQRFADPGHAEAMAGPFFDTLLAHGTTTAAVYGSVHPVSVEALFAEAARRDIRVVAGKVMMDRHAPAKLLDTAQQGYDESKAILETWHGRGRLSYAITPRFALTSSPAQLEAAGALLAEFPDAYLQTHVDESVAEIDRAAALYPEAPDYVGIYERYGLLGPRTLLGHCIHMRDREVEALAETGSVAVFCPSSNLFLGSGLFDRDRLEAANIRIGVATDIGAGTSYSMLATLDAGYKVLQLKGQRLSPLESFFMMTLGNARALCLEASIGSLEPGMEADLAVLDARAVPHLALRLERIESLEEELFLLQTGGDARVVAETYVAGVPAKTAPAG